MYIVYIVHCTYVDCGGRTAKKKVVKTFFLFFFPSPTIQTTTRLASFDRSICTCSCLSYNAPTMLDIL